MEILFWIAIFLIVYTYIGYPVIIFTLSKLFSEPVSRQYITPEICVVMVVYNGEKYLENKINNIVSSNYPSDKLNIVIVSDGSTDNTVSILEKYKDKIDFHVFKERRGKAACLNDAVLHCKSDFLVFVDVRQRLDKDTIHKLVSRLADPRVGAVSGELFFEDENHNVFSKGIDAYWKYEKFIRNSEAKFSSVVGVTGAVYAIRKSLYKDIPSGVILDDVFVPMQVVMSGFRVVFEPDAAVFDFPSNDKLQEKNRKIRTLAGNYQLVSLMPELLNPFKNSIIIQFISHKLLRLFGPFLLLIVLISNTYLLSSGYIYQLFFILQLFFYSIFVASILDIIILKNRLIKLSNTFVLLNWYSFLGLVQYIKGRKTHLW